MSKLNTMREINNVVAWVSPAEAQAMIDNFGYELQRPINRYRIDQYAAVMRQGDWRLHDEIIIAYAPDENGEMMTFLINGYHRLNAVIKANVPVQFKILHLQFDTLEEVGVHYGIIDINKVRTPRDIYRARRLAAMLSLNERTTKALMSTMPFLYNGFRKTHDFVMTIEDKFDMAQSYAPSAAIIHTYMLGGITKIANTFYNTGMLSVALVTVDESTAIYGENAIREFWHGIVQDDGLKSGDPRKLAVKIIFDGLLGNLGHKNDRQEYVARAMAHCFNHFVLNKECRVFRPQDLHGPFAILGSKYTGKELVPNGKVEYTLESVGAGAGTRTSRDRIA